MAKTNAERLRKELEKAKREFAMAEERVEYLLSRISGSGGKCECGDKRGPDDTVGLFDESSWLISTEWCCICGGFIEDYD